MTTVGLLRFRYLAIGSMCIAALSPSSGKAQTVEASLPRPRFDASAVKRTTADWGNYPHVRGGPGSNDPGRFMYHSGSIFSLLQRAFGVKADQLEVPGWMRSGDYFYDVNATMPPDTTEKQFQLMLQDLLIERFQIVYHVDHKSFPAYELTVAPGGPKIQPDPPGGSVATPEEPSPDGPRESRVPAKVADGAIPEFPVLKPGQNFLVNSGRISQAGSIRGTFHGTIPQFGERLPALITVSNREGGYPRYRVVDRTGLEGYYSFHIEFFGSLGGAMDAGGPSIFQALERQLGLKLNKTKDVELDVIVVDSAERIPIEN